MTHKWNLIIFKQPTCKYFLFLYISGDWKSKQKIVFHDTWEFVKFKFYCLHIKGLPVARPCSFVYLWSMVTFVLLQWSGVVETKAYSPQSHISIFNIWPITGKFADHCNTCSNNSFRIKNYLKQMCIVVKMETTCWLIKHRCNLTENVVSILTTMHICLRACWLLTSLLTVFKYAMACDSFFRVKCLACACSVMLGIIL